MNDLTEQDVWTLFQEVFDTPKGYEMLEYLKWVYTEESCVKPTPEQTYYALGQKELIESLDRLTNSQKPKNLEDMYDA